MREFIFWGCILGIVCIIWADLSRGFERQERDAQRAVRDQAKFIGTVLGRPFSALSSEEAERVRLLQRFHGPFRHFGRGRIQLRRKLVPVWKHAVSLPGQAGR